MSGTGLSVASPDRGRSADEHVNANARRIAQLLHVSAVSVLVTDPTGTVLRLVAASHPTARALDARQAALKSGPAYAALQDRVMRSVTVTEDAPLRWPLFTQAMARSPFTHGTALPVMHSDEPVGVVMLYHRQAIRLSPASRQYAVARLLAAALVTEAVREKAMSDLRNAIAELGALVQEVDRIA